MKMDRPIHGDRYARADTLRRSPCAPSYRFWLVLVIGSLLLGSGCRSTGWVHHRQPSNSMRRYTSHAARQLPAPSPRTMLLLRTYDLVDELNRDPEALLARFAEIMQQEPSAEKLFAYAELARRGARHFERTDEKKAFDLYVSSAVNAYMYLFDERFEPGRNTYDPQFRGACDLYNRSLTSALRIVNKHGGLQPGLQHTCRVGTNTWNVQFDLRCEHLKGHEFEGFDFAADYELNGISNRYVDYGLGVALIAKRKAGDEHTPLERHYPKGLSIPLTAFLRVVPQPEAATRGQPLRAVLELHDPLVTRDVVVAGRRVPLETDLTTPLAYFLNQLEYTDIGAATSGLFRPGETPTRTGLHMLEPYQPGKIPVVLVHGIWSTPITWVGMFNDLRSIPEIRKNYQFWFYFYPTGQSFVLSAAGLRDDLAEMRTLLDPPRQQPALDQMVLIGHSMGGLISRMQTLESGNLFWEQVAQRPLDTFNAKESTRRTLQQTYFFQPNPSIRRVVTIATPHHGSSYSNTATRWLGRKLIGLPPIMNSLAQQLQLQNPEALRDDGIHLTKNSIDSLAPDSPALQAMQNSKSASWVVYHNILAKVPEGQLLGKFVGESDGIVEVASARTDDAVSEIVVGADHRTAHRHPRSVLEVRRILLEHLASEQQTTPVLPKP